MPSAYGWGFLGQYAIGITQSIYDLLDDEELEAVIDHEIAHIKCKDVGIMSTFTLLADGFKWFAHLLSSSRNLMGRRPAPLLLEYILKGIGKYVFGILRWAKSIHQAGINSPVKSSWKSNKSLGKHWNW